jgi:hypothetical protein
MTVVGGGGGVPTKTAESGFEVCGYVVVLETSIVGWGSFDSVVMCKAFKC